MRHLPLVEMAETEATLRSVALHPSHFYVRTALPAAYRRTWTIAVSITANYFLRRKKKHPKGRIFFLVEIKKINPK